MPPDEALARLKAFRAADPSTHGGRVLSSVDGPGRPDLDAFVAEAGHTFLPVDDTLTVRSARASAEFSPAAPTGEVGRGIDVARIGAGRGDEDEGAVGQEAT